MTIIKEHIIRRKEKWVIETRTGYDGPFEDKSEASKYLRLLKSRNKARSEYAGLDFSPS